MKTTHFRLSLSLIIALLMAGASLAGLLFQEIVYPNEELQKAFLANDVVNLIIGLPILLGSMALARNGKLIGLLFWPGALFYVTYNYLAYAIAMPLTWPFVVYLALVALSLWALINLLASLDQASIRARLLGTVPERFAGGVLAAFGVLFFIMQGAAVVQSLSGQGNLNQAELATATADLIVIPAWIVGGILLWRKHSLGYLTGAGLLFQASMLFVGLLVFFLLQPILSGVAFPAIDFVVILLMGLVCFVPFGLFIRGIFPHSMKS